MRRLCPLLFCLTLACGESEPIARDGGGGGFADAQTSSADATANDAGLTAPDAEPIDAGEALDGGDGADGGMPADTGTTMDAGPLDTGAAPDAGAPDTGAMPGVADPEQNGPLAIASHAETIRVSASGNDLPLDCRFPTAAGSYPLIVIGHGFRLPASQYTGYAQHLATFGFVACTVDFVATFVANHSENADDVIAGIDRLVAANTEAGHPLNGKIDVSRIGATGHSLGGKVSFIAASRDARIGAVFGLDPVDTSMLCDPTRCPDASDLLPFSIPVGVIGETLDSAGRQACAPAVDNFQTFYDAASSPAFEIDALGAGHMSFIDDPSTCGLPCRLCNMATAPHPDVLRMTYAITTAFFMRHLVGDTGYDTYLTGPIAQMRYVQTQRAAIRSK